MRKSLMAVIFTCTLLIFVSAGFSGTVVIDNFSDGTQYWMVFHPGSDSRTLSGGTIHGGDVDINIGPVFSTTGSGFASLDHRNNLLSVSITDNTTSQVELIYDGVGGAGLNLNISAEPVLELTLSSKDQGDLIVKTYITDGSANEDSSTVTVSGTSGTFMFDFTGSSVNLTDVQKIQVTLNGTVAQDYSFTSLIAHEPTVAVDLTSFQASPQQEGILIEWTTTNASFIAGYNVLRSTEATGEFKKINPTLISSVDNSTPTQHHTFIDRPTASGEYYYKIQEVDVQGRIHEFGPITVSYTTGIPATEQNPNSFSLAPNFPNPFNPTTTIQFHLATPGHVQMEIVDSRGKLVNRLLDEAKNEGTFQVQWTGKNADGQDVASGIYFAILTAGGQKLMQKMTLVR